MDMVEAGSIARLEPIGTVMGVDPGKHGGIAFVGDDQVMAHAMPLAGDEVDGDALAAMIEEVRPRFAVVERASARPGQGTASMFNYGCGYGLVRGVLVALRIPTRLVTPGVWKRHFRLDKDKDKSRALAIQLWPGSRLFVRKGQHGLAEAALLALYARQALTEGRQP